MVRRGEWVGRRGLTLLELLLSLSVSAVVLAVAVGIIGGLAVATAAVRRDMERSSGELGSERLLRQLVGSVDVQGRTRMYYEGEGDTLRFSSWCPTARGWQERCTVSLVARDSLMAAFPGFRMRIGNDGRAYGLLFLSSPGEGGSWIPSWRDSLQLPFALGVVRQRALARDTMILRIGVRG